MKRDLAQFYLDKALAMLARREPKLAEDYFRQAEEEERRKP